MRALYGSHVLTIGLALVCTASTCNEAQRCSAGRTPVDGVCVSDQVADYVACVRAKGAELSDDKSRKLSADVKTAGVGASAASEVKDRLEKKYAATSDTTETKIIEQCARMNGARSEALAPTPAPTAAPEQKAAAQPTKPKDLPGCTTHASKDRSLFACVRAATWNEARTFCEENGASLVSVADAEENAEVTAIMRGKVDSFYIGLSETGERHRYQWTDGTSFTFASFYAGEPSKVGMYNEEERCVEINTSQGLWNDSACGAYKRPGFVCASKRGTPRKTNLDSVCQKKTFNTHSYLGCTIPASWYSARSLCRDVGMDLVSIQSPEENAFVTQLMAPLAQKTHIGFTDLATRGTYVWANGVGVTYTGWKVGQPDHWRDEAGNEERCTELWTGVGQWNDIRCAHEQGASFVCESL